MSDLIVRRLDSTGDPTFGKGLQDCIGTSAATAQKCKCRLQLILGEWFLDTAAGIPWVVTDEGTEKAILGEMGTAVYGESLIKQAILGTAGIATLNELSLDFNHETRASYVRATVTTDDGDIETIEVTAP